MTHDHEPTESILSLSHLDNLSDQLATDAAQKLALINSLTSPDLLATANAQEVLKLAEVVRELGSAAYALSQAGELLQDFADTKDVQTVDLVPAHSDEKVEQPTTQAKESTQAEEYIELPDKFEIIPELNMTDNEVAIAEQVVDLLKNSEKRRSIENIVYKVFGTDDVPVADKKRLIQILDTYSVTGLLQRHRNAFGYLREDHPYFTPPDFKAEHFLITDFIRENSTEQGVSLAEMAKHIVEATNNRVAKGHFHKILAELTGDEFIKFTGDLYQRTDRAVRVGEYPNLPAMTMESPLFVLQQVAAGRTEDDSTVSSPMAIDTTEPETPLPSAEETTAAASTEAAEDKPDYQLSEVDAAYLKYALTHNFRSEELSKTSPFSEMSKEEWQEFKNGHEKRREYFVELFASYGVKANWTITGQRRGQRYELTVNGEMPAEIAQYLVEASENPPEQEEPADLAGRPSEPVAPPTPPAKTPTPKPKFYEQQAPAEPEQSNEPETAEQKSAREERREALNAIRTAQVVVNGIQSYLRSGKLEKRYLTTIRDDLSENFGISKEAARAMISHVVEAEHFYYGAKEGKRILSEEPTERRKARKSAEQRENDAKAWTQYDVENSALVIGLLNSELTHVQQGLAASTIERRLGIEDKAASTQFRRSLRKIQDKGLIEVKETRKTRNAGRSQPNSVMQVKLASQQIRDRWKTSASAMKQEFESWVEPAAANA